MSEKELLLKAKIPHAETGIEIKQGFCDICAPGSHCGIDAYVKDGVIIKIEGSLNHPVNHGLLCPKGLSTRQYIYRADRIMTPLRRVGARGEGKFEPISWEEAYTAIAEGLNSVREKYGADSVAFFSGYPKWFRAMLRRFCHAFGSINYGTESSACFTSTMMSWKLAAGAEMAPPDIANASLFLGWCSNSYHSSYLATANIIKRREKGMKVIIIDTRRTPAADKLADLFLQVRPGTDCALALCFGNLLIQNGHADMDYIREHVHGFERYAEYVGTFDPESAEKITGVPAEKIRLAARMIGENGPVAINSSGSSMVHHINGLQSHRAIMGLSAILGTFDRRGGNIPVELTLIHTPTGYKTREHEFMLGTKPDNGNSLIGASRFPLWSELEGEMQAVDLPRQILEGRPYPARAVFAMGMNYSMFGGDYEMKKALMDLDFFVDVDLFMTDTASFADIVLPACSSLERGEFKGYRSGLVFRTKPVIKPLYDSKPDCDILSELAEHMKLPDPLLRSGYWKCMEFILDGSGVDIGGAERHGAPMRVSGINPPEPGKWKFETPTGKFELYSTVLEKYVNIGLEPLPKYYSPLDDADENEYPFVLCAGARLPTTLHSRLHDVPWLRSVRPEPTADIAYADAERLGIKKGDTIEVYTQYGSIRVKAKPSIRILDGTVHLYHGYREADANSIIGSRHNDPYSGFPGYLSSRCGLRLVEETENADEA